MSKARDHRYLLLFTGLLGLLSCVATPVDARARHRKRGVSPASGAAAVLDSATRGVDRSRPQWQVTDTANFRILHFNRSAAERVGKVAERERDVLWRVWTGKEEVPTWPARCTIYLYPSQRQMIVMTGGEPKAGSAQVRPSRLYRGRILSRRVNLTADDPSLLDSTLPHEVSHLVYGDIYGGNIPLWANEGAATMAESARKQRYYSRVLRRFLRTGQVYKPAVLFRLQRYPDYPYQSLFYAQSSSLVSFLLSLADGPTFVRFVGLAQRRGYNHALREVYEIGSHAALHRQWLKFLRNSGK